MGMIDRMASVAVRSGKSVGEFRHAADRHAHAAWMWIVGALVLGWAVNWWFAAVLFVFAAWSASQSIVATLIAERMVGDWGMREE